MKDGATPSEKKEMLWVATALEVAGADLAAGREGVISPALLSAAARLLRRAAGELAAGEGD